MRRLTSAVCYKWFWRSNICRALSPEMKATTDEHTCKFKTSLKTVLFREAYSVYHHDYLCTSPQICLMPAPRNVNIFVTIVNIVNILLYINWVILGTPHNATLPVCWVYNLAINESVGLACQRSFRAYVIITSKVTTWLWRLMTAAILYRVICGAGNTRLLHHAASFWCFIAGDIPARNPMRHIYLYTEPQHKEGLLYTKLSPWIWRNVSATL